MRGRARIKRSSLLLVTALFGAAFASGCSSCRKPSSGASPSGSASLAPSATTASDRPKLPAPARQGSVIAYAADGTVLYVADEDASVLHLVPLPFGKDNPARAVALPGRPAQVLPLDGEVLVTIRDPGLLLMMRPDAAAGLVEAARVALPADAWGIAVTGDEKTALVSSAWTHQVSGVDIALRKVRFSVDVPREPRGIAVLKDGSRAYISHLVGSALTRIDGIGGDKPTVKRVVLPAAPLRTPDATKLSEEASLGYALMFSADERRLFVARHAFGATALDQWAGVPTIDVLLPRDDSPFIARRHPPHVGQRRPFEEEPTDKDGLVRNATLDLPVKVSAEPRALSRRPKAGTLLVVGEGADTVGEFDADAIDPSSMLRQGYQLSDKSRADARPCGAPSGIAVSPDDRLAYVFCRSTNQLAVLTFPAPENQNKYAVSVTPLGEGPKNAEIAEGRRLFYDATESFLSDGVACSGCHPEGRDDGFTWVELRSPTYLGFLADAYEYGGAFARQTPMLAGRVSAAGPYGWHGESASLEDRIYAGASLHRKFWQVYGENVPVVDPAEVRKHEAMGKAIVAFLRAGLVPPPRLPGELSEGQKRGKELFESAAVGCRTCHSGPAYTDRVPLPLARMKVRAGFEEETEENKFKTPSLLFVGGTPPYFHDGQAATLEDLIKNNDDRMGKTNHLSAEDRAALIAFLRTL